jgi:negative regulator of sigma E activity
MDGELDGEQAHSVLACVRESQELRQDWQAYHLIGDFLRSAPLLSHDFVDRFAERLAQEPTVVAQTHKMSALGEGPAPNPTQIGDSISRVSGGKN